MLAMPGLRGFSLAEKSGSEGVSCDAGGVFVGGVPLLQSPDAGNHYWTPRSVTELNKELTARYRLPVDIASKAGSLGLIAAALNRGDLAMAAIAAVQMQFPDPPPLAKRTENPDELARRARELIRSRLLKFWDPALHPRAGVPPNPGEFAPVGDKPKTLEVIPDLMTGTPADKPSEEGPATESEKGGNDFGPPGVLEIPLPGESPRPPTPSGQPPKPPALGGVPASPAASEGAPRRSWAPPDPKSKLPFMAETEPQLAPYKDPGPTSGIFKGGGLTIELRSGKYGPAEAMPKGSPGFDGYTRVHVEGHAAALMRQLGISEAWLRINNPEVCDSCRSLLKKMLPPGAILHIILPDGTELPPFVGITP